MRIKDLKKAHIWIIGASSGIGAALALELSKAGATLALSARREDELNKVVSGLEGQGNISLPADVGNHETMEQALKIIAENFPQLDSVIFLPAIYSKHTQERKELSFIHKMIHVNLGGAFETVETVLPLFEKQTYGQIVLCGSVAGYRGLPYGQPYCATKAGVISYAESLRIEFEDKNIDVKVINPGFVKTPLTDKNDFSMPMIISSEKAAQSILKGIQSSCFEISFPFFFVLFMKFLGLLPNKVFFIFARLMKRKT